MKNNSVGSRFKRSFLKFNKIKSLIFKSILTIIVLLLVVLFTKIDKNPTNRILGTIKTNINYEFQVKEDSAKIYNKAKNIFNSTLESIPVFNSTEKLNPPVVGQVYRSFDSQIESSIGIIDNGGVEIKLENDMDPMSIIEGRVINIVKVDNKGYFITIENDNIKIVYGYLEKTSLKEGDIVNKGDIIGEVGINKDGNKYLRVELYIDDKLVDPEKHIYF